MRVQTSTLFNYINNCVRKFLDRKMAFQVENVEIKLISSLISVDITCFDVKTEYDLFVSMKTSSIPEVDLLRK